MCANTVARGSGPGHAPPNFFLTKWFDLVQSRGIFKYVITNLKSTIKNQQENLIGIFLSQINLDEHVRMRINTFRICPCIMKLALSIMT